MKRLGRCAASWAEQNGIQQVRFGLDRKLGDRAGFRRNEQMLSLKPRYVIAFQGNGVTERLVIEAKKLNIHVVDRRGPLGRSEEHTSELQSLMRNSYAVFCLKQKKHKQN